MQKILKDTIAAEPIISDKKKIEPILKELER